MHYDIGIVGGAGPIAGRLFFDYIIKWYQVNRHAWRDQDFPSIIMASYPFSDMLFDGHNKVKIEQELSKVVSGLQTRFFIIACNTLHCFGEDILPKENWIHLMELIKEEISNNNRKINSLVLCTTTSRKYGIHAKYFNCDYPSSKSQPEIDTIINNVLKGSHGAGDSLQLQEIIRQEAKVGQEIILGCTELSLLFKEFPFEGMIIDPAILAAEKIGFLVNPNN